MNETKRRVLVADDDELVVAMLEATLTPEYEVLTVAAGDRAIALLQEQAVDAVVLDVEMPGLDGYETCQALRADAATADLPVLFHSARTHLEERLRGYAAGGDDYLAKPFDPVELSAKLDRLITQRIKERQRAAEQQQDMAGQLDDMINAVLSSADMVGEAGVVLDFQRRLTTCADHAAVAQAMLDALARYGLEGCVRITGRSNVHSTNGRTLRCSALEMSILDHLQAPSAGPRIRALGQHTGFGYSPIVLFVRNLCMARPETMDRQEAERHGRHIDNVALVVEGALTRVAALDAEQAARDLASTRDLVDLTRDALTDISAQGHAQRMQVRAVLGRLAAQFEQAFLSLGLTQSQEDFLIDTLRERTAEVMDTLARSQEVEARLQAVIERLAGSHA